MSSLDRDKAVNFIYDLLRILVARNGSDLFITAGAAPSMKLGGKMTPQSSLVMTPNHTMEIARAIMNEKQAAEFEKTKEANFAISPLDIGRFRVSVFFQQGVVGMVIRRVVTNIPRFEELGLPPILRDLALQRRGLIIFVGGTGQGKTTSVASLLDYRNENSEDHIITLEDPVEFVHPHKKCLVTQREIGVDTQSWEIALKNTLRQAPDVIFIGEVRERETMAHAIQMSETGHLCLMTLHANNANQALDRVINFFPEDKREQLLMDLALNLRAIISQRLVPLKERKGRCPAVEVMINSPLIKEMILAGQVGEIKEIMKKSVDQGMQTFDQAVFNLYEEGKISYEDALRNADSVNDVRLRIKLESKNAKEGVVSTKATRSMNIV